MPVKHLWLVVVFTLGGLHPLSVLAGTFTPSQTTFSSTAVGSTSAPVVVTLVAQASGSAAAPEALTEGTANASVAEFSIVDAGTCGSSPTLSPGQSCTVTATFTPRLPGIRHGAIRLRDNNGHLLASTLISGPAQGSLPVLVPGTINTVVGNGQWFYQGDNVPGTQAAIYLPSGLAVDGAGNLFLSDSVNNRIRRIDAATQTITTVAGTGTAGSAGDGGAATSAQISSPAGLALDGAGNLYFADSGNNTVRRVDAISGIITTVAGTPGSAGYSGNGHAATSATLNFPQGIAISASGDLVIADYSNAVIRVVTASDGNIQTIAGTGTAGYNGDNLLATSAQLNDPSGVALRADGALAIADLSNNRIRLMTVGGNITTVAGNGSAGYLGDGASATQAELQGPTAVAFDPAGDLFIADSVNNCLRLVYGSPGTITTLAGTPGDDRYAGDGGPSNQARMHGPDGLLFDASGNLWFSDHFNNRVREITGAHLDLPRYATMKVGKKSPPVPENMLNAGNQSLALFSPNLQQAALDAATTTCGQGALASSAFCSMGVEFAPTTVGNNVAGSITWTSNAPNVSPVDALSGTVLDVEPTTTVLSSNANPGLVSQAVLLTATVTSADTGRTGTVDFLEGSNTWCSAVPLAADGTATCNIPSLSLGTHNFVAQYGGDNNNASSTSATFAEVIKQQAALALGVSSSPATVTSTVTLTLSAADNSGTPTGSVVFYDGQSALATVMLDGSGHASWSTNAFTVGTHSLSAQYSGDSSNIAETSNTQTLQVTKASTTTVLNSSNGDAPVGSSLTFTANVVTHSGPSPTGTVQFLDSGSLLGTGTLDPNGVASLTVTTLTPGTHSIVGRYTSDANNDVSSSAPLAQTVEQISTVTTLGADQDPANAGATIHLAAIVSMTPGARADGDITGIVSFKEGSTTLGSSPVNSGQATLALNNLAVGSHPITAVYSGNGNYAASTSATLAETIQQTASTVSLNTTAASTYTGKPANFTISVSSATGVPTGTVSLRDGATSLGTVTLNANGSASFSTAQLATGTHSILAVYAGDANYQPGNSPAVQQTVSLAPVTLVLGGPSGAVDAGTAASFTVVLSTPGVAPTGTLQLLDGTAVVGSVSITAAGTLTFTTTHLAVGTHQLVAHYAGDADNASASSAAVTTNVQQAITATALVSSANPLTLGQPLTLTATLSSHSPNAGGTVTFLDGTSILGSATVGADGTAAFSPTGLPLGTHQLRAVYNGDTNHAGSTSDPLSELVVQTAGITLNASLNPSVSGQNVTFVGQVNGAPAPTGTLQFLDNGVPLATVALNVSGAAAFSTSTLAVGAHTLSVSYSGDEHFATGAAQLAHTVLNAATSASLTASANPATFGQALTLLSIVNSNGGAATGTVDFLDAGQQLGSALLDSSGHATLITAALAPGEHTLTVSYHGDGKASPSVSAPLTLVVKQSTTLGLASDGNPALTLSPVTLTATLGSPGAAPATGAVIFQDGSTTVGQASLDASGHATLTLRQLAAGTHTLTASFAGDDKNFGSQSAPLAEVVHLRTTTTTVTGTGSDTANPQQMTLIAVVHGEGSIPPSGLVTFSSGSLTLGVAAVDSTGVAAITVLFSTPTQQIVASYAGDISYSASASQPSPITAGKPAQFTVNLSSTEITLVSHQRTTVTVTLASIKGFTDNIALGCLGLPYAATCSFDHSQLKLGADGQVTASLVIDTGDPLGAGTSVASVNRRRSLMCFTPFALLATLLLRKSRRRHLPKLLLLAFAFAAAGGLSGCSGLQMTGTPAGTYSFRVIGTGQGSNTTQAQTVTLVVTQ